MSANLQLTLALPGLLWPHREISLPAFHLSALDKLRQWGKFHPRPSSREHFYRQYLWQGSWLKVAQSQLGLLQHQPSIIAIPTSQQAGLHHIHCRSGRALALTQAEAENFCRVLNEWLAQENWLFHVVQPDLWLLTTPQALQFNARSVLELNNLLDDTVKPTGRDAPRILKYQTELQMLLHQHPLNQTRCANGKIPINAIWFEPDMIGNADGRELYSNCSWTNAAKPFPPDYASLSAQINRQKSVVLFSDDFCHADIQADSIAYQHLLQHWEQHWWQPLMHALKCCQIQQLNICTDGALGGRLSVRKPLISPFWRNKVSFNGMML